MFIRLIPSPPHSAVLFAVAFPDLDNISLPPSWVDQLRILQHDHLEIPSSIHVLDRAAGLVCIITEITFDVPALTISCKMVDGSIEEWPLVENGCLDALSGVVSDVNESAEMERVTELESEKRRAESPTGKVTRHKKQRSLLMTLVASIIPSISLGSPRLTSGPPTPTFSSSHSLAPELSPSNHRRRARATLVDTCRRYVLSELGKRLPPGGYYTWILQSLLRRATQDINNILQNGVPHQYHIQSPFTDDDAASTVPIPPNCDYSYDPEESEFFSITAASLPPTPDGSDEEDDTGASTETDESSVHTPTSSSTHFPITTPVSISAKDEITPSMLYVPSQKRQRSHVSSRSHSHTNIQPPEYTLTLSPSAHAAYNSLLDMHSHLQRLQHLESARQRVVALEEQRHFVLLEVRGRRRAWLNRQLCKGVESVGMATPFKSSPLVTFESWGEGEWEYVGPVWRGRPERVSVALVRGDDNGEYEGEQEKYGIGAGCDAAGEYGEFDRVDMRLHRTSTGGARGRRSSRLFPVSEEDVEDLELGEVEVYHHYHHRVRHSDDEVGLGDLDVGMGVDLGIDLESGYGAAGYDGVGGYDDGSQYEYEYEENPEMHVCVEVESPRLRPRPRPIPNQNQNYYQPALRVRTNSIYKSHLHPSLTYSPAPIPPTPVLTPPPPQNHLTPSSLLCQPLPMPKAHKPNSGPFHTSIEISDEYPPRPSSPSPLLELLSASPSPSQTPHPTPSRPSTPTPPPAYAELDVGLNLLPRKCDVGGTSGEFTLAMDLDAEVPFSVRVKRGDGYGRGGGGVASWCGREEGEGEGEGAWAGL